MAIELKNQPQTEEEYWRVIEDLGAFQFGTNHGLAHESIKDPDGKIRESLESAHTLQQTLAREISEKFGVILPQDYPNKESRDGQPPAPEGKTYYWDWYEAQKRLALTAGYDKIICSACPLSEGLEAYIRAGGERIPCKPFTGTMYKLVFPYSCGMVSPSAGDWTRSDLMENIIKEGGLVAANEFIAKEEKLRNIKS